LTMNVIRRVKNVMFVDLGPECGTSHGISMKTIKAKNKYLKFYLERNLDEQNRNLGRILEVLLASKG